MIAIPLTYIINNSISEGEFPDPWKIAKVIPIFKKKGLATEKQNYRPVSNLKSVSKVIEILINKQVLNFLRPTTCYLKVNMVSEGKGALSQRLPPCMNFG